MLTTEDQFAIRDLIARYCAATDGGRPERLVELFAEDAVWTGDFGHCEGRQALLDFMLPNREGATALRHLTINTVIEGDGDSAKAYSYIVVLNASTAPPGFFFTGFYEDAFSRRDGRWLFQRRRINAAPNPGYLFGD